MRDRATGRRAPAAALLAVLVAALLITAAAASAVPVAASAAPSAGCLPLLGGCPASSAPTVTLAAATAVTTTTATLNAQVTPNGAQTSYQFEYAADAASGSATTATGTTTTGGACGAAGTTTGSASGTVIDTPTETLAAGTTAQSVTAAITGLEPCTAYTIAIVATNSKGSRSAFGTLTTAAPTKPALTVALAGTNQQTISSGQSVTVTARAAGQIGYYTSYFGAPTAVLTSTPKLQSLSIASLAHASVPASGMIRFLPVTPTRNTRFRVQIDAATSAWLTVYVQPLLELYRTADAHRKGVIDLAYDASGDLPGNVRRGPRAWFYRGPGRSGPFTRVGTAVFTRHGASLEARTSVSAKPGGYFVACTRSPIIPNMGRPFHDSRCGGATIS